MIKNGNLAAAIIKPDYVLTPQGLKEGWGVRIEEGRIACVGNTCRSVATPAPRMEHCRSSVACEASIPLAFATRIMGTMFPTNMAKSCWNPSGNACANGGRPFNS